MRDFILRVYIKYQAFLKDLQMLCKVIWLAEYLYKNRIFHNGDPSLVLRVLQKFTEKAYSEYNEEFVMGRTPLDSTKLLSVLIDRYFETKSKVTLDQILQVLRVEFILRESKSGRE